MRRAHAEPDSKAVAFSGRLFQRLLAAYPEGHRREYGRLTTWIRPWARSMAKGDSRGPHRVIVA